MLTNIRLDSELPGERNFELRFELFLSALGFQFIPGSINVIPGSYNRLFVGKYPSRSVLIIASNKIVQWVAELACDRRLDGAWQARRTNEIIVHGLC